MNLNLTDKAIKAIEKHFKKNSNIKYLRIFVKGGSGCNGFSFAFQYEEEKNYTDIAFVFDEVATIILDPKSLKILDGATLDYHNSLIKTGFKLDIPNAKSCGCGKSFSR